MAALPRSTAKPWRLSHAFESMHYAAVGNRLAPEPVYTVDGDLFERWMLKALCGGLFSGNMRADGGRKLKGVEPPLDWLGMLYGGEQFPERFGLYSVAPQGSETFKIDRGIFRFSPLVLRNELGTFVHGICFIFSDFGSRCWRPGASQGPLRHWPGNPTGRPASPPTGPERG